MPRRALHARDDLVGLTGVDEHAAHLGDLVGAPAPAEHARGGAAARARLVGDDREVPGAEADHRVRAIVDGGHQLADLDRKSTRLNSSHSQISYAVFCLKKKKKNMLNVQKITNR